MKKLIGDNDPTPGPRSVFFRIKKRSFKNNNMEEATHKNEEKHENIGD